MKRILTYSILTLAAAPVFMATAATPDLYNQFDGFGIGIAGAYYATHTKFSIDQEGQISPEINFVGDTSFSDFSPYFHGQVNFGHAFSRFYIGIRGFADIGETSGSTFITTSTLPISANVSSSLENVYGVDLTPGVLLTPKLLVYTLAGVAFGDINGDVSFVSAGTNNELNNHHFTSSSTPGLHIGLGAEYLIIPHLSATAEWSYMAFDTVGPDNSPDINFLANTFVFNDAIDMSANRLLLGLNYRF